MIISFQHDKKVLNGEVGSNLFPKPVHEEGPFDQRDKLLKAQAKEFAHNLTMKSQASGRATIRLTPFLNCQSNCGFSSMFLKQF